MSDEPSNVLKLTPSGTDHEVAAQIRAVVLPLAQQLCDALADAKRKGFDVAVNFQSTPFGQVVISGLSVSKTFST